MVATLPYSLVQNYYCRNQLRGSQLRTDDWSQSIYNAGYMPQNNQDKGNVHYYYLDSDYQNDQTSDGERDYSFGMGDADWGMGWGSKIKAGYERKEKRNRNYDFGMSDGDWGMGWGSPIKSGYVRKEKRNR